MVAQLQLQLVQSLRYSSNAYLVHRGVVELIASLETLSYQRVFSLGYVQGAPRTGKTHLGVHLVGALTHKGRPARMVSREEMVEWFATEVRSQPLGYGETIVLDDGDVLLEEISRTNQSGIFMDLTEKLIQVDGTLVILGSAAPDKIACTKQIQSRLNSGLFFGIDAPVDSELAPLLDLIAKQRGFQLSESKKGFIVRRVSRTLPALVECIEKVEEPRGLSAPCTSFNALSEAVGQQPEIAPSNDHKRA